MTQITEPIFRIEVVNRLEEAESVGTALARAAHQLGITALETCAVGRLFFLKGNLIAAQAEQLAQELLADPVTEEFTIVELGEARASIADAAAIIEVTPLPGVTDPAAENLLKAAHRLGVNGLRQVATGRHYRLTGNLSESDIDRLITQIFSNPVVQQASLNAPISPPFFSDL